MVMRYDVLSMASRMKMGSLYSYNHMRIEILPRLTSFDIQPPFEHGIQRFPSQPPLSPVSAWLVLLQMKVHFMRISTQ